MENKFSKYIKFVIIIPIILILAFIIFTSFYTVGETERAVITTFGKVTAVKEAGLTGKVWQFFTVVPDFRSTGVRNGKRVFDWPVIIRAVNTVDAMTATVPEIDYEILKKITIRILAEVPGVCRVLYDLSPKGPATIEWE